MRSLSVASRPRPSECIHSIIPHVCKKHAYCLLCKILTFREGRLRPIPCHVCYSLDSIFCKQLRKLSIWNDIHILVYYLQWTYIHIVSIGIKIFQTPPLIFHHDHILLCHVCYIRRFQFFGTIQQSVKFCEVLGLWITINKSILSTLYIVRRTISAKYSLEAGKI